MPLLSMDQAKLAKLRQVLDMVEHAPIPAQRSNRTANARVPVLVRCTSATAAGGAEVGGDQCYPAVVLNINSLVDEQEEAAEVWLTLLDGGSVASPVTVAVPVAGNAYYGVYSGSFDPDPGGAGTDPRPRVFAVVRDTASAFTPTFATSELGGGSHFTSFTDSTWVDVGISVTLPAAGTYLLFATATGGARLSAGGPEYTAIRLLNVTDSTLATMAVAVASSDAANDDGTGSGSVQNVLTVAASKTIRMEAIRTNNNTSTWSATTLVNGSLATTTAPGGTRLGYLRLA